MTPQDTPPPLAPQPSAKLRGLWNSVLIDPKNRGGSWKKIAEAIFDYAHELETKAAGVDQGNGVRGATPAERLFADCEQKVIAAACQLHLGHVNDDAPFADFHRAVREYLSAPSPSEAKQSKAPTPNPKAKDEK